MLSVAHSRELRWCVCFFFQAEDGIRDLTVTGVQTCALPIYRESTRHRLDHHTRAGIFDLGVEKDVSPAQDLGGLSLRVTANELDPTGQTQLEIGRASCRERV